jgi:hypothetical protein
LLALPWGLIRRICPLWFFAVSWSSLLLRILASLLHRSSGSCHFWLLSMSPLRSSALAREYPIASSLCILRDVGATNIFFFTSAPSYAYWSILRILAFIF